jgi:hypothetical protein
MMRSARDQAVKRLRPLARRRAISARPALVRIRERKPCLRLRRRLLGWKVRFIDLGPEAGGGEEGARRRA